MLIDDAEIIDSYVIESEERLETIEEQLLEVADRDETANAEAIQSVYREMHTLKGSSAFLGFLPAKTLCHAAECILQELMESGSQLTEELVQLLIDAVDEVRGSIRTRKMELDEATLSLCQNLEAALHAPLTSSSASQFNQIPPHPTAPSPTVDPQAAAQTTPQPHTRQAPKSRSSRDRQPPKTSAPPASPSRFVERPAPDSLTPSEDHRDTDVYATSYIQQLRQHAQTDSTAELPVARLLSVAESLSLHANDRRFARTLLDALLHDHRFQMVDRVCLTAISPGTHQIVCLDSAISSRIPQNTMSTGYACYVDPQGSLFQLKPGMVRTFADSHRVVKSFRDEQRPVQRSLANVAGMGLRSGICLAFGSQGVTQGFLFLNSTELHAFAHVDSKAASFLAILSVFAKAAACSAGLPSDALAYQHRQLAESFCEYQFTEQLQRELQLRYPPTQAPVVKVHRDTSLNERFLYTPFYLVDVTAASIEAAHIVHASNQPLHLLLRREGDDVVLSFLLQTTVDQPPLNLQPVLRRIAAIRRQPSAFNYRLLPAGKTIEIRFPYDLADERCGSTFYSTI